MPQFRWEDRIDLARMRKERVDKLREEMKKDGIGTYVCFNVANCRYLTDVYPAPLLEKIALSNNVIFPRAGEPIYYTWGSRWRRIRDELAPWLNGNVKPGYRLGWHLARGIYPEDFLNDLKYVMAEHGLTNEPVAIDMPVITLDIRQIFEKAGIRVVDGSACIQRARMVKTEDEINCQRMASAIGDEVYAMFRDMIRPGIREYELLSAGIDTALKRGADEPPIILVCSGENTTPNLATATDRPIKTGDLIFFDVADISWHGYHVCYYRTFSCGKASQRQKENYAKCLDLTYRSINKVKEGVDTGEICEAWPSPEYWGADSWWDISECAVGHSIGLSIQEFGISPLFSYDYPIKLKENMVIALESWYGTKEHPTDGCRFEETMVVTEKGYDIITKWPKDEITECH